jgi:hypothetical protein
MTTEEVFHRHSSSVLCSGIKALSDPMFSSESSNTFIAVRLFVSTGFSQSVVTLRVSFMFHETYSVIQKCIDPLPDRVSQTTGDKSRHPDKKNNKKNNSSHAVPVVRTSMKLGEKRPHRYAHIYKERTYFRTLSLAIQKVWIGAVRTTSKTAYMGHTKPTKTHIFSTKDVSPIVTPGNK